MKAAKSKWRFACLQHKGHFADGQTVLVLGRWSSRVLKQRMATIAAYYKQSRSVVVIAVPVAQLTPAPNPAEARRR
jgi:hypothetical protein